MIRTSSTALPLLASVALLTSGALLSPVAAQEAPKRVYVPFDSTDPAAARGEGRGAKSKVFVPREVYEDLMRRAFPTSNPTPAARPVAPALITRTDYRGRLDDQGLSLVAEIAVDVLAEGWQRVPLGLMGTGLQGATVKGTHTEGRVRVAPAGGYELLAQGPGKYTVSLDLIVPRSGNVFAFATVPCLAAQMAVQTPVRARRLVVAGARAQREQEVGGETTVLASLGDAERVSLSLRSREELSAGASEASATSHSLVWVRRGRLQILNRTTFKISGAGREGFVFVLPEGLEVTDVAISGLRGWHVEGDKLKVALRRPATGSQVVTIKCEQKISGPGAADAAALLAPQIAAQGVSRESGTIGLAADAGLKVRPKTTSRLRQVDTSRLSGLARELGVSVGWAYGFSRRPATLELEWVDEAVEVHAETRVRASVRPDRYAVDALIRYDVRRGKVYQLRVLAPAGFTLVGNSGLDVREVDEAPGPVKGTTLYTFGLGSGLTGSTTHRLRLVRRLALAETGEIAFPDVRPLGVTRESTQVAVSTTQSMEVRAKGEISGLTLRDVDRLTSAWQSTEAGGTWKLGYERVNGRVDGLASAPLLVTRPSPHVTGSWVLHARVERDVVRYTLRTLYEIEHAGVERFRVQVPTAIAARARIEALNRREVKSADAGNGMTTLTVELQSPAEVFYDLALTWEEVLPEGKPFTIPQVNVADVDRAVRGFVLVEKAPEVADLLEEDSRSGVIQPARASNAPALPPNKGAEDFVLVYDVPLKGEAWEVSCRLKEREVKLPPPAQILWARLESVFTRQGEVRHRVRYQISNLRLQFLALELPEGAEVWSVFVAGRPRRLHKQDRVALIPLPKRSAADLPFQVELTYATPPAGNLGEGSLEVFGPKLRTERVQVQKTFWTAYLPEGFTYDGFEGSVAASEEAESSVVALQRHVEYLAHLEDLARSGSGKKQAVANDNLARQRKIVRDQLAACQKVGLTGQTAEGEKLGDLVGKYSRTFQQLEQQIDQRQKRRKVRTQQQLGQELTVGGQAFAQGSQSQGGWNFNKAQFKGGNQVRWGNMEEEEAQTEANAPNQAPQQNVYGGYGQQQQKQQAQVEQQRQRRYVVKVNKGKSFKLDNAEVFQGQGGGGGGGGSNQSAMLDQSGRSGFYKGGEVPSSKEELEKENRDRGEETSEGLLSIRVGFATPGRAFHFVSQSQETPRLEFKSAPTGSGNRALRVGQGLVLLLLLAALLRLGLHLPAPGKGAAQTLLLLVAVGLAAASLAHPGGLALTVLVGLAALRHGRLWPAGPTGPAA